MQGKENSAAALDPSAATGGFEGGGGAGDGAEGDRVGEKLYTGRNTAAY